LLKRLTKARRDLLKARLFRVRTRLQLLEQYSEANVHGFADILRQLGNVLSKDLQEPATVECHTKMDIFTDAGQSGAYMRMAERLRSIMKLAGVDKAAILVHEQKLQKERGLASPSVSEAHFALETWDDDVRDEKNYTAHCFVGLCGSLRGVFSSEGAEAAQYAGKRTVSAPMLNSYAPNHIHTSYKE
jgi:hypothetical protein